MIEATAQSRQLAGQRRRFPFLTALAAFGIGIVLDRTFEPSPLLWIVIGAAALLGYGAIVARQRPSGRASSKGKPAAIAIAISLFALGGLRHCTVWTLRGPENITRFSIPDGSPIRVIGVVDSSPEIIPVQYSSGLPTWRLLDRTICSLRCETLLEGASVRPTTGLVRVVVDGHLLHVQQGERVDLVGELQIPRAPKTPSDFDYPAWLRARGIDRVIAVNHPDAVRVVEDAAGWRDRFARFRHRLRDEGERLLSASLSPDTRAVGISLLLGTRTGMTDELREAFINSGTMHLLAISGLHIVILLSVVLVACRLLNLSPKWMSLIALAFLWGYTFITDMGPPVTRSAFMGTVFVAGTLVARQATGMNALAAAGLAILIWNPCDLTDVGAQLSFLAVAAIIWSSTLIARLPRRLHPILLDSDLPRWQRTLGRFRNFLRDNYLITLAVWLWTLPITLTWFGIISPIGFVINVALLPFSWPLLGTGFLTLAFGLLWQPLGLFFGFFYDLCLKVLLWLVNWSAATAWGHWFVPGPSVAWLCGFYALLAAAIFLPRANLRRWNWRGLAAFVAVAMCLSLRTPTRHGLTCTFIDVGHGGATLIELPNGRSLLYDAGTFIDGRRARDAITEGLWDRRVSELDGLVISHADADHFNAAAGLMNIVPIAGLYVSQGFLDFRQLGVLDVVESASSHGLQHRIIQAGDRLDCGAGVEITALHPAGTFHDDFDNANSIVLLIRYAGRSILLTGDIERAGLAALLKMEGQGPIDVLQSPHHGSKSSNTADLARWARPSYVVACNNDEMVVKRLSEIYRDAEQIFVTATAGAVTVNVTPQGELSVNSATATDR
jgi:competence protein ComEC